MSIVGALGLGWEISPQQKLYKSEEECLKANDCQYPSSATVTISPQNPTYVDEGTGTGHEEYGQEEKWIPTCFCGNTADKVVELGDGVWKCVDRHLFSEPWEPK
jgi:hypothetical protein